jgi:hypothetical protein
VSDRKILNIIRRHSGEKPKESGTWPHEEIEDMIAASHDARGFSAQARADLLYVVNAFGRNPINPISELTAEDESALKAAALAGIETAERFRKLSPKEQAAFIDCCVLSPATNPIGFKPRPIASPLDPADDSRTDCESV